MSDLIAGRYQKQRLLGQGGMGEVWLGTDTVLGRPVAIKAILRTVRDPKIVDRMQHEARVASRLRHPYVVTVHDLVIEDGWPTLIMEYVEGESLADLVRRLGPLAPAAAAGLVGQVASALAAAHKLGIVHRDIKPSNILVERDGTAKLADFGIAHGGGEASLTETGQMMGTIAYMAPESAATGATSDASDVWSLGATLYAALEGHPPHGGTAVASTPQAVASLLYRQIHAPAPQSQRAGPLDPVLSAMLCINPESRPTAADAAAQLTPLAVGYCDHNPDDSPTRVASNAADHDPEIVVGTASAATAEPQADRGGTTVRRSAPPDDRNADKTTLRDARTPIVAPIVPVAIVLNDRLSLTIWAPAWVDSTGEEMQGFLGTDDHVLAFRSADSLADYLAADPDDDLAPHPQWASVRKAPAPDLRAGADDLIDFDNVFRLLIEQPNAPVAAVLSKTIQLAQAIAESCEDGELADVLSRDAYQIALYQSPSHYSRKMLESLWRELGNEVTASWEWVLARLGSLVQLDDYDAPVNVHAVQRRGPTTTPWLASQPSLPAKSLPNSGRDVRDFSVVDEGSLPSSTPTVLVTIFFGLFGLIPAAVATSQARALGVHTGKYWSSFGWTLLISFLLWVVLIVLLVGVVTASR